MDSSGRKGRKSDIFQQGTYSPYMYRLGLLRDVYRKDRFAVLITLKALGTGVRSNNNIGAFKVPFCRQIM
jgi:hypothetical protein